MNISGRNCAAIDKCLIPSAAEILGKGSLPPFYITLDTVVLAWVGVGCSYDLPRVATRSQLLRDTQREAQCLVLTRKCTNISTAEPSWWASSRRRSGDRPQSLL